MHGEFIGVWPETWNHIWNVIASEETTPDDLFCELYRELSSALKCKLKPEQLAEIIDDPVQSRDAFKTTSAEDFSGERSLVEFFEGAHEVLSDFMGGALAILYFDLLSAFIEKFSLRYDLRGPCVLCPTLPGMFASLVRYLRAVTSQNAHLDALMRGFEQAIRDLRYDCSDDRIKTCIGKQFMLLEGLGEACPGVTKKTLGAMCDELDSWPHATIREALKKLYGFASDYPGIRHGLNAKGALRGVEMRDMVAMSILLVGFTPYLTWRGVRTAQTWMSRLVSSLIQSKVSFRFRRV